MPLVASVDYPNKRIYLSAENIGIDIQPIEWYREIRERRRLNADLDRNFPPMIFASGNESTGPSKATPRFTNLASGVKIVPFDAQSNLLIRGNLISTVDGLEGRDLFDRSSLVSLVDIDYDPPQTEIITITTGGSALTPTESTQLANLASTLKIPGVFTTAALANAPTGSGEGGDGFQEDDRTLLVQIAGNALIARKGVTNRHRIDPNLNTGTIYDDDGIATLVVFDLSDRDGNAASEAVYQRTPRP